MKNDKKLKVIELFAGIGAQNAALSMSGIKYETVAVSEIDNKTYLAYCALNNECPPNLGDITKVERLPKCDLVTFSAPCTDISSAGQRRGMEEGSGTRSSLLFEVARILEHTPETDRPDHLIGENVSSIINKKNFNHFDKFIKRISCLGYSCKYCILNAKDFGIPQNRKRCFIIFNRTNNIQFPKGWELDKCMEDVLEEEVDIKYYLSQKAIDGFLLHKQKQKERGRGFGFLPLSSKDIAHTVTTKEGYRSDSNYIIQGCNQIVNLNKGKYDSNNRVYDVRGCSPTISTYQGGDTQAKILISNIEQKYVGRAGILVVDGKPYNIRRITPRECFRLFGFTEEQINRVFSLQIGNKTFSNSSLYKMAGNSIVVPVLSEIFKKMFIEKTPQQYLFD